MQPAAKPAGLSLAELRWRGAGRRRSASPFEMLFKKSLLKAGAMAAAGAMVKDKQKKYTPFKLTDFRKDVHKDTILDLASYRKEFDRFDTDGDKLIDVTEFGKFLRGIGLIPSDDEVREIFDNIDKNKDGSIEFEEFITVLDHPMVNLSREEVRKSMEESVRKLEPSLSSGRLPAGQLRRLLTGRGNMRMTDAEVEELLPHIPPKVDDLIGRIQPGGCADTAEIECSAMVGCYSCTALHNVQCTYCRWINS